MERRRSSGSQVPMTPVSMSASMVDSGYPRTGTAYSSKPSRNPPTPQKNGFKPAPYLAGPIPVKPGVLGSGSDGCLQRVPYASLIACVLCLIGVIMFAVMMAWAFNASVEQTRRALHIEKWHWLDRIQVFFVALAVLMAVFSLFLLAVGILSTGATREEIFTGPRARCGGRVACAIALIISYILTGFWLVILSMTAILCAVYYIFDDVCRALPAYTEADCLDFSVFRPLVSHYSEASLRLCGGDAEQFCALSATAATWYVVGWVGSLAVVAGLIHFLLTHAANYAHVNNASRYVELRDVILQEEQAWHDSPPNHYTVGPPPAQRPPSPPRKYPPSTSTRAAQYSDGLSDYAYGRRKGGYPQRR